jgi:hypothetical protein
MKGSAEAAMNNQELSQAIDQAFEQVVRSNYSSESAKAHLERLRDEQATRAARVNKTIADATPYFPEHSLYNLMMKDCESKGGLNE